MMTAASWRLLAIRSGQSRELCHDDGCELEITCYQIRAVTRIVPWWRLRVGDYLLKSICRWSSGTWRKHSWMLSNLGQHSGLEWENLTQVQEAGLREEINVLESFLVFSNNYDYVPEDLFVTFNFCASVQFVTSRQKTFYNSTIMCV